MDRSFASPPGACLIPIKGTSGAPDCEAVLTAPGGISARGRDSVFRLRLRGSPGVVRGEVWALDKTLAATTFARMEQFTSESLAHRRLVVTLLGVFAAIALLLALGLYVD